MNPYRLLLAKPLYKLTITDRQAGRQAGRRTEKATAQKLPDNENVFIKPD